MVTPPVSLPDLTDGSLQGSPVWYWFDGVLVHVSTPASRQKYRNLRRDPRLVLTVFDPAQPLRYIEIRGTAELHDDPDGEMRDRIAVKHGFPDGTAFDPPGAKRVIATIIPPGSERRRDLERGCRRFRPRLRDRYSRKEAVLTPRC